MIFLNFVTDYLSKAGEGIMGTILHGVRTLFYSLDTMVYKLIISAYNVFRMLCRGRLLDETMLKEIATRVGLILGMVMFLTICFSMIQIILEPDKLTDKEMGAPAIIKKVIITIIMLGSASFVFTSLYNIQNYVIDSNIISNLLLPKTIANDSKNGKNGRDKFGNILSMELLMTFYRIDDLTPDPTDADAANTLSMCETTLTALQNQIYNTERFDLGYNCLNETIQIAPANSVTGKQDSYVIDFNWLFSLLCGCVVLYLMVMYCFSVGIRIIQLAVLEIISPMAIISYVSPKKDNMFSKWIKIYISTYIDVFIRIAIIDFVVLLLAAFFNSGGLDGIELWNSIGANSSTSFGTKSFITVVMIIALLTFAKKAPDLIKELLPASASKIGFGASMKNLVGLNKGLSTVAGAASGAAIGFLGGKGIGAIGGAFRGASAGFKAKGIGNALSSGASSQRAHNQMIADWRAEGGTSHIGRVFSGIQQNLGINPTASIDKEKAELEKENQAYEAYSKYMTQAEERAEKNILKGKFAGNKHADDALKAKNMADIYRQKAGTLKLGDMDHEGHMITTQSMLAKELEHFESEARRNDALYNTEIKAAQSEYITQEMSAADGDAVIKQAVASAQNVATSNSNLSGFAGAQFNSYSDLDTTNNKAKAQQSANSNTLYRNQTDSSNVSARADKKFSGSKK